MQNVNVTNFRQNIFAMLENTVKYNEPLNITTRDGNAVVLSEDDYNSLMETLRLLSSPEMRAKLLEGRDAPLSDCLSEGEVEW